MQHVNKVPNWFEGKELNYFDATAVSEDALLYRHPFTEIKIGLLLGNFAGYFINKFRCDKP